MKKILLILTACVVLVAVTGTAYAQTEGPITGLSSLDFSGNFTYALAVGNDAAITIGDANFVPYGVGVVPAGVTQQDGTSVSSDFDDSVGGIGLREYGATAADNGLEDLMNSHGEIDGTLWVDFAVTPGIYKIQLLFGNWADDEEGHTEHGLHDVWVLDGTTWEAGPHTSGMSVSAPGTGFADKVWTYTQEITTTNLGIYLEDTGTTTLLLNGLTIEEVPEPTVLAMLASLLLGVGLLRRRR